MKTDKFYFNPENTNKSLKNCNSVLLVDDDDIDNTVNLNLFRHLNFSDNIHICKNGREAINHLRNLDIDKLPMPDLIVLDINMRVMNGYEFLREFKTLQFISKGTIKIIVLTNMNSPRDKVTVESLGINFIEKPMTKEKLLELFSYEFRLKD